MLSQRISSATILENISQPRSMGREAQYRLFLIVLFIGDLLALTFAFMLAYVIRFYSGWNLFEDVAASREAHVVIAAFLLPIWLLVFLLSDLYNPHYLFSSTQEYKKAFTACAVAFTLVIVGTYLFPFIRISRGWIVIAWGAAIVFVIVGRFLLRHLAYSLRERGYLTARMVIVGTDQEALAIAEQLASWRGCGAEVVGFADNFSEPGTKVLANFQVIGSLDNLPALIQTFGIDELIVSPSALPREDVLWLFQTFGDSDKLELRFAPGLYEIFTSGVRVKEIGSVPLVSMRKGRLDGFETVIKALSDYTIASIALLLQVPMLLIVALIVKLDSPGPVFHRRHVIGRGGREFDALKFRTMYVNGDELLAQHPELTAELAANQKLKHDPRITRSGHWLRKLSIDEMPQLINVLLGQMSLVGPRMITPAEVAKYGKWRLNLLTVKPGITGQWQISGRSDVSYAERVRLDMYYIRNYTLWSDLQIMWRTIPVVLGGKGAY